MAQKSLEDRFGTRLRLEYVDLAKAVNSPRAIVLSRIIEDLPLPSLLINGSPRISGQFDIRMLLDAADAEMDMRL